VLNDGNAVISFHGFDVTN